MLLFICLFSQIQDNKGVDDRVENLYFEVPKTYAILDGEGYIQAFVELSDNSDESLIEIDLDLLDREKAVYYKYTDGEFTFDKERWEIDVAKEKVQEEEDKEHQVLDIIQKALLKSSDIALQASPNISDEDAIFVEDKMPMWQEGKKYTLNQIVKHNGRLYRISQQEVTAQANQQPDSIGMLAVYRPIGKELPGDNLGTLENPIPFEYGMDVDNGKYYSYENKVYLAEADMKTCVWYPGTAGMWQWKFIK